MSQNINADVFQKAFFRRFSRATIPKLSESETFLKVSLVKPVACIHLHVQPVYYCEDQKKKRKKTHVTLYPELCGRKFGTR